MKITKQQIEFFKSYVSTDETRPVLGSLYLDLDTLREDRDNHLRFAKLVATDGFVLGSIEIELTEKDKESFIFPFEHLEVSKHYLSKDYDFVTVEKVENKISYITSKATIEITFDSLDNFPDYKKAIENKIDVEYSVGASVRLLKKVAESHIKLGYNDVTVQMSGGKNPISFKNFNSRVFSILMPQVVGDEDKGKLQKN